MAAVLAAEGSQCKDDFDCSLAGKCTADGVCACKSWATGPDCATLNLVPPASAAEVKPLVGPPEFLPRPSCVRGPRMRHAANRLHRPPRMCVVRLASFGSYCICSFPPLSPDLPRPTNPPRPAPSPTPMQVQPHDNWTRWGGSPVHDPDTGLYHLFSAEMADKCSLNVWGTQSTVIHSTSTSATGPFTRVGLAIGAEAHNPVISRATDGTWLIWTCGCPNPNPPSSSCTRTKLTCPGGQQAAWTTTARQLPTSVCTTFPRAFLSSNPTPHALWARVLLGAQAYLMLIGACNPM